MLQEARFLTVIAGPRRRRVTRQSIDTKKMDRRVKPGDDADIYGRTPC